MTGGLGEFAHRPRAPNRLPGPRVRLFGMAIEDPPSAGLDRGGQPRRPRSRFWRDALRRRLLALADLIAAAAALVVVAGGLFLRAVARWIWRRTTPREVTAVVGDGELAEMIRRKLQLFPDMH